MKIYINQCEIVNDNDISLKKNFCHVIRRAWGPISRTRGLSRTQKVQNQTKSRTKKLKFTGILKRAQDLQNQFHLRPPDPWPSLQLDPNPNGEAGSDARTQGREGHHHHHHHQQQPQEQEEESRLNETLRRHWLPFPPHILWVPLLHSFQDRWRLIPKGDPRFF